MEKKSLPQKIEIYSKELIRSTIKIQLSLMGPVGVAIDEMLFGIGDRIRGKRLEQFVYDLSESIKSIDENLIDGEFFKTEEFHDILLNTLIKATKTRHREKIKLFANVIAGSLKVETDIESLEDCAEIIAALTLKDISVLKSIISFNERLIVEKAKAVNPTEFNDFMNSSNLPLDMTLEESEVMFSLTRLTSLGLLKEYYEGNVFGSTPGGNYRPTKKINDLVKIITMPNGVG